MDMQKKKEDELESELFNILHDYGDFFLTNYPSQSETKSIHPTIARIKGVIAQLLAEKDKELEERVDRNLKTFAKEGKAEKWWHAPFHKWLDEKLDILKGKLNSPITNN